MDAQSEPKYTWLDQLDPREQMEVLHALDYVAHFNHGASGHLAMTVIAKLAVITDHLMSQAVAVDIPHWVDGMLAAPKP